MLLAFVFEAKIESCRTADIEIQQTQQLCKGSFYVFMSAPFSRGSMNSSPAEFELNGIYVTFVISVPIHFFFCILTLDVGGPVMALWVAITFRSGKMGKNLFHFFFLEPPLLNWS